MHTRSRAVIPCQHFLTEIRLGVASMVSRSGRGGAQTRTFGAASMDLPAGRRDRHGLSLVPRQVPTSGFVFGSLSLSRALRLIARSRPLGRLTSIGERPAHASYVCAFAGSRVQGRVTAPA